jgi:hypothetical protein
MWQLKSKYEFLIFIILVISALRDAHAERRAIVFGGVDHPPAVTATADSEQLRNQFMPGYVSAIEGWRARGWQTDVMFDGAYGGCTLPASDRRCQRSSGDRRCCPGAVEAWSSSAVARSARLARGQRPPAATRQALIDALTRARDQMSSGDELVLQISTHGDPGVFCAEATRGDQAAGRRHQAAGRRDQATHRGVDTDSASSSDEDMPVQCERLRYDDPEIQTLLEEINSRGVRMAFLVGACRSGSAMTALQRHGCVVTSAAQDELAYSFLAAADQLPPHLQQGPGAAGSYGLPPGYVGYDFEDSVGDFLRTRSVREPVSESSSEGTGDGESRATLDEFMAFTMARQIQLCQDGHPVAGRPQPQISGYDVASGEQALTSASLPVGSGSVAACVMSERTLLLEELPLPQRVMAQLAELETQLYGSGSPRRLLPEDYLQARAEGIEQMTARRAELQQVMEALADDSRTRSQEETDDLMKRFNSLKSSLERLEANQPCLDMAIRFEHYLRWRRHSQSDEFEACRSFRL